MKPRVLILCTGNSARSQMAEAILRRMAGDKLEVFSAGTEPRPVHPLAIRVMSEIGIDISKARSKHVGEFLGQHFSYIITVCDKAERSCPVFPGLSKRFHKGFEDPAISEGTDEERLALFRRVRDEIRMWLEDWCKGISESEPLF